MEKQGPFGGEWTREKLGLLTKYLRAYMTIFTRNPKARFFKTVYVDAFAGAGYIQSPKADSSHANLFAELGEAEAQAFIKGSAARALELHPPFSEYLFIDRNVERCRQLEDLKRRYKDKLVCVQNADANEYLREWCRETSWTDTRGGLLGPIRDASRMVSARGNRAD